MRMDGSVSYCTVNFYAEVDGTCIACPENSSSIYNSISLSACVCNKGGLAKNPPTPAKDMVWTETHGRAGIVV